VLKFYFKNGIWFYNKFIPYKIAKNLEKFIKKRIKGALHDFLMGLISGIPICCIIYFINTRKYRETLKHLTDLGVLTKKEYWNIWLGEIDYTDYYNSPHYIICPKCLKNGKWKKNTIKGKNKD